MSATATRSPMSPDAMSIIADVQVAGAYASGALVIAMRRDPVRLVFASATAAATFRASSLTALEKILFADTQAGAARLTQLATMIEAGRPPRLERLRFNVASRTEVFEFHCRGISVPDAETLFVAVCANAQGRARLVAVEDLFETRTVPSTASTADGEARAAFEARVAGRKMVRFVWETDARHLTTKAPREIACIAGEGHGLSATSSLPERAQDLGADPHGHLARALERQVTFSGLDLPWPVEGLPAVVPIILGGQPMFDTQRRFSGYRGFGVIRVDRLTKGPLRVATVGRAEAVAATGENGETLAVVAGETSAPGDHTSADPTGGPPAIDLSGDDTQRPVAEADSRHPVGGGSTGTDGLSEPAELRLPDIHAALRPPSDVGTVAGSRMGAPLVEAHSEEAAPVARQSELDVGMAIADGAASMRRDPEETVEAVRPAATPSGRPALTTRENDAFDELANLLQARLVDDDPPDSMEREGLLDVNVDQSEPTDAGIGGGALSVAGPASVVQSGRDDALPAHPDRDIAAAMERLPMGVLVTRGGAALYANRTLLDLLGHADLEAFHAAGGLDYTLRGRDPNFLADDDHGGSIPIATADGGIMNVDGHLQAMMWGGAPATLMSFRRSMEMEIARRVGDLRQDLTVRESEAAELHAILDTATDGIAVLDGGGHILSLNRSAEALFGLELSDVIGEPITTLLAPESHAAALDYLDGLKKSGVASVLNDGREVVGRAGRRGVIPLFMTIGPLQQHVHPRFCAVLRDLTPWKRSERDLHEARRNAERASQLKSDFLARVSHEIRTPLNAILGFAEVIMEERFGAVGNERYKEYLHDIHASGVHVMNIVNDLLDLSKIEAGKMELTFASVDANKLVADCVALMQPQAYHERVIIRMALAPRLPNVVADDRSLRQIILNILSNAVNFNEAGGQIIVSTALTDSGTAVLRVRDTGIGMSESELESALEPFRQLPTARKGTGTGLGLPLTKALADANRATFSIKSKKNEGTLVEIGFPSARVLSG